MFSQACIIPSVYWRGGGVRGEVGNMCGNGGGYAWWRGHAWQRGMHGKGDMCGEGGMHGEGGMCGEGGMHG